MLPEAERRRLNNGAESSLVPGLHRLRAEVFESVDYDTVVVFDSHWATTVEYVVSAQRRRTGLFTSDELPRGMCRIGYDLPGDADLAHALAERGAVEGTWITAVDDEFLPISYATVNLWTYLGVPGKPWVSISVCQTGDDEDNARVGRALRHAVAGLDRRLLVIASGALSHTFWPLRQLRDHEATDPGHIFTPEAADADRRVIDRLRAGDHASVLATMPEFARFKPEARFAHYLMMVAALGETRCTAQARCYSEYENAAGTGQIHLWFDRPATGWTGTEGRS